MFLNVFLLTEPVITSLIWMKKGTIFCFPKTLSSFKFVRISYELVIEDFPK